MHTASQLISEGAREASFKHALKLGWPPGDRILGVARRAKPARIAQLLHDAIEDDFKVRRGQRDPRRNVEALTLLLTDTISCL